MKNVVITVKKEFIDRYTGKKHKPGENLTVTDARFREIKRSGEYAVLNKPATEKLIADKNAKGEQPATENKK